MSELDNMGPRGTASELLERDRQYMWHHMTPHRAAQQPLIMVKGEGCWVEDAEGRRYLDGMSGLWCVNLGYSVPELAEEAARQLREMPYYPLSHSHPPAIELAERLSAWLGGGYRVFFSNSGSEANEVAFSACRRSAGATGCC